MQPDILTVFFSAYEANIHRSAAQKIMPLLTWASFIISTLLLLLLLLLLLSHSALHMTQKWSRLLLYLWQEDVI